MVAADVRRRIPMLDGATIRLVTSAATMLREGFENGSLSSFSRENRPRRTFTERAKNQAVFRKLLRLQRNDSLALSRKRHPPRANVDRSGANDDCSGANVDRSRANDDCSGTNDDCSGANVDRSGANDDCSGTNVDHSRENDDRSGTNVDPSRANVDPPRRIEGRSGENHARH